MPSQSTSLSLPKLIAGRRFSHPLPAQTADALLLAQLARRKNNASLLAVVCADASDAQRLCQEIPFFLPGLRCALFPDWETLPYEQFSPHQDLISARLATLWQVRQGELDVVLIPASTALYRLAPPAFLAAYTFSFAQDEALEIERLQDQLQLAGYHEVSQVMSRGEYALRGSLIDLFPMGASQPYRVDVDVDAPQGGRIHSIRVFDPDSQRSLGQVQSVRLLPGREFPMDEQARVCFRRRWRELLEGDPTTNRVYKDMGAGIAAAGIEYYLPLFFMQTATVFDYLGDGVRLVLHGDINTSMERFWQDTRQRWHMMQGEPNYAALAPEELFLSSEEFYSLAREHEYAQLALRPREPSSDADWYAGTAALPEQLHAQRGVNQPLQRLSQHIEQTPQRVLILAETLGRRESLIDFLRTTAGILPQPFETLSAFRQEGRCRLGITVAPLTRGFSWLEAGIDLITEAELFAGAASALRRPARKQEQVSDLDTLLRDLAELKIDDPIVHSQHGIGRYRGLINMDMGQKNPDGSPALQEFLHLEYADDAVLYVPVSQLGLISRYSGSSQESAPLHRLGSAQWEKAKRKAAQQVRDSAAELLNIYARRAARTGQAMRLSPQDYARFCEDFGFEETPDQQAAIAAVVGDLISPRPMDRLVCGDVGFGKTEVALRAAFIAAMAGKQVALLAPTTLLAEQHYQTLVDRFARWPLRIAEMSRFRTAKEIKTALQGLEEGSIDIVVGTHKLLSAKTQFHDLGLLIIDEEHRFGVRHKEAIKAMRSEVDVLTLTATPIPRTMGMALEGLRDLSVIATAPQRRLAIKTFVRSESQGIIREAVLREFKRGGQVYFLHNEVATIEARRQVLENIVPEARIAIAHGQMPERELEKVMRDFVAQRVNLLVCSTIIETGIDVPSANTILISRADKFGLAQLHQLRGRVGRSHHQAYAYLMVPDVQTLTKQAEQRLEAIQEMQELGSGFYLAMHDLEIRGAGEVLGENQSGNMMEIGFQLYSDMLAEAVRSLKEGKEPDLLAPLQASMDINLHAPALLPSDYCADVQLRLSLYKRLASAKTGAQIDTLLEELVDRFGTLPAQAQTLVDTHRLRVLCQPYGVLKLDATPNVITISFHPNPPVDPLSIIDLIQKNRHIKLAGNDKLRIERALEQPAERARLVREVLSCLKLAS